MRLKIPLSDQITEAERHRDELAADNTDPDRLHRSESIILTLRLIQAQETDFRQYMAQRSKETA